MCDEVRPRLRSVAAQHLNPELRSKVDASDIVQDAMTAAVRAPQFRGQTQEEWEAWLVQIVKTSCTIRGATGIGRALRSGGISHPALRRTK
jgi:DNA-directed RNA polymerase specialized sigma24 family protein